jgi:hypothetical protein
MCSWCLFRFCPEDPNMTATQVIELVNEKGTLVAPVSPQHTEYVGGLVERELDLLGDYACSSRCRRGCAKPWANTTSPTRRCCRWRRAPPRRRLPARGRVGARNGQYHRSTCSTFRLRQGHPRIARDQQVPELWMASDDMVAAKRRPCSAPPSRPHPGRPAQAACNPGRQAVRGRHARRPDSRDPQEIQPRSPGGQIAPSPSGGRGEAREDLIFCRAMSPRCRDRDLLRLGGMRQ